MGDAKRRKQLGLMPTVHPFEADLDTSGNVTLNRGPQEAALQVLIVDALRETQPTGPLWDSAYRTSYVMAGRPDRLLETADDVQAIPVPPHRRYVGELALGTALPEDANTYTHIPLEGGVLHLRQQTHSADGVRWESFPANTDPRRALEFLMQHPAAGGLGKVVATFRIEQAQGEDGQQGRVTIDPEPPEEWLEVLEELASEWHGQTPEEWAALHAEQVDEDEPTAPVLKRSLFELREPALLLSPLGTPFAQVGGLELHIDPAGSGYSLDGEEWITYDPDAARLGDSLPPELSQFLDVETVTVTVFADGRVEWQDDDVPADQADRIRADLMQATGAGHAERWADWTENLLLELFADEYPDLNEVETLPVPTAVRLDIPVDALTDTDPLAQAFIESELTFDGETWHDLYAEELPAELSAARPLN
ncbi:hypothetical protein [Deinococcus puniceus]|uniref:Uncharacterized protein n=1 Tax=Deinococcus puniceus TaxID=1182568 RepID=A0A172T9X2_9DEIO|nr:hypothetical protein [Deinococcus puniceus]ANE43736.1 hypothetical protein SU48_08105 [Deinococcus puniceus]